MKTTPTVINEHVFIRRLCLNKSFSSRRMPEDVIGGPFESSKNFNDAQFLQTSVYPNARVLYEINTTGKRIRANPQPHFIGRAISDTKRRCLEFCHRARIQYRKRIKLFITSAYRAAIARQLAINGGCRLRLSQRLWRYRLRARRRCMLLGAGGVRVPIPRHLAAPVHSFGHRSS
jgi:hypothetical protein